MTTLDPARLLQTAAEAAAHAHAPYSLYRVGAALLTRTGAVFPGCNVENASYGLTLCAERVAMASAVAAGHREFAALAIVASSTRHATHDTLPFPCGACRQVMAEFCPPDFPVYVALADNLADFRLMALGDLLPRAFRFHHSLHP